MTIREREALRRANAALHRRRELHARRINRQNYKARAEWAYLGAVAFLSALVLALIAFAAVI
jgi:hypothetical protein